MAWGEGVIARAVFDRSNDRVLVTPLSPPRPRGTPDRDAVIQLV